jgi:anhydro-N-acetylmuramic acid kinase
MYCLGLMSGTSLDGLDIALCKFEENKSSYQFEIIHSACYSYNAIWKKKLAEAPLLSSIDLIVLSNDFGNYLGELAKQFLSEHQIDVEFIASHGHTVFHQPEKNLTFQIGNGANIAAVSGIKTICDFRTTDVALEGQGAPLVPIGDKLLFEEFDACLNLGGFANISFDHKQNRIAFDICPVNIAINYFAEKLNMTFDKGGMIAAKNKKNEVTLAKLNQLSFYQKNPPKSLGREWLEELFLPQINLTPEVAIATITKHAAIQISRILNLYQIKNVLITGGGAYNNYLIEKIKQNTTCQLEIPNKLIIEFKEALVFAFLGYLRLNNKVNTLKSVTGAKRNSIGGCIYLP